MKRRVAKSEITTVKSDGKKPVYVPFRNGERIITIGVKDKSVVATFKAVEGAELGNAKTSKENETFSIGYAKTVCLIIETQQETEFELITIR